MSIGNINIGVVLNDKQSLVNPLFASSLVNWWSGFFDHGALHQLTMRSCHLTMPWWTYPKLVLQHDRVMMFKLHVTSWLRLNRIDRILISTRYTFFSGSSSEKNSKLSMLGLERFDDGWPTGKLIPGAHEWGQSAQKRLVLVCGASLEILESCQG
jgi:hypothetical protein